MGEFRIKSDIYRSLGQETQGDYENHVPNSFFRVKNFCARTFSYTEGSYKLYIMAQPILYKTTPSKNTRFRFLGFIHSLQLFFRPSGVQKSDFIQI